jgi:hypothetical protein
MVAGVEPAVVGMAEAIEFADVDHDSEGGAPDSSFKCQFCDRPSALL